MNYRHAFHAGNFADCMKHALLVWLLRALQRKPAIFVLDTHAGAGRYDLSGEEAERTGEWRAGIGRLLDDPPAPLVDYVALVSTLRPPLRERSAREAGRERGGPHAPPSPASQGLRDLSRESGRGVGGDAPCYPGSPALIRALLRPDDRLACCELHPEDHAALRRLFAHDPAVAIHRRDGWEALGALLPPKQRRGLVLIDPPYEAPDEFDRLARGLITAHARFRTGTFAAWYPIKHRAPVRRFHAALQASPIRDIVTTELTLRDPIDPTRLNGCGVLVINPPYRFETEVPPILTSLLGWLGTREPGEGANVIRLVDE